MNVVLIGASGQLGRLIAETCPADITLVPLSTKDLDLTDARSVKETLERLKPEVIINAAAYTAVDKAETDREQAFLVNATGPELLARHMPETCHLIHVSTDFVFDGNRDTPYPPEAKTDPLGVYGESKRDGEIRILTLKPEATTIVRTAWLYSAGGQNFMNTMLRLMQNRDSLGVVDDQRGTPTSAHGLAAVIWGLARKPYNGILHWTDQGEATWYEFACAIQEEALQLGLLEKAIPVKPITTADYPTPARRPAYSVLDSSLTIRWLEISPRPWREALREALRLKTDSSP